MKRLIHGIAWNVGPFVPAALLAVQLALTFAEVLR